MRTYASQSLQRAKDLIAKETEAEARYACLELRFCIEYITYSQLQAHLNEVSDETLKEWTPKQIISVLRKVNSNADSSISVTLGAESFNNIPLHLGKDRRFSLKWAYKQHNALGNFLHASTLSQIEKNELPTKEKILKKAKQVIDEIDQILNSPIFNVIFGYFYNFTCLSCETKIKCRIENISEEHSITCPKSTCKAVYDIVSEQDKNFTVSIRKTKYICPSCETSNYVGTHLIAYGKGFLCINCNLKVQIGYCVFNDNIASNNA